MKKAVVLLLVTVGMFTSCEKEPLPCGIVESINKEYMWYLEDEGKHIYDLHIETTEDTYIVRWALGEPIPTEVNSFYCPENR